MKTHPAASTVLVLGLGFALAAGSLTGCSRRYTAYDHFSLQSHKTVTVGGNTQSFADDTEFGTISGITDKTIHLELAFGPYLVEAYGNGIPAVGDTLPLSRLDIYDKGVEGSGVYQGASHGILIGIPFAIPDGAFEAAKGKEVEGSKLEWKRAMRYEITWNGIAMRGECHMLRYSHTEHESLGSRMPPPASTGFGIDVDRPHPTDPAALPALAALAVDLDADEFFRIEPR
jgi:hypothetical protein